MLPPGTGSGSYRKFLTGFTGPSGKRVKTGLPEPRIVSRLERSLREIRDTMEVSREETCSITPEYG